jgi:hypothetical protein
MLLAESSGGRNPYSPRVRSLPRVMVDARCNLFDGVVDGVADRTTRLVGYAPAAGAPGWVPMAVRSVLHRHGIRVDSLFACNSFQACQQAAIFVLVGLKSQATLFAVVVPGDADEMFF